LVNIAILKRRCPEIFNIWIFHLVFGFQALKPIGTWLALGKDSGGHNELFDEKT
jgi:hypothetical protein